MIIDAHIHLDKYEEQKRQKILERLFEQEIEALIAVSVDLPSCIKNQSFSFEDTRIKAAFGFHPEQDIPSITEMDKLFVWMEEHVNHMVAVGEVGLPYYKKVDSQNSLDYEPYIQLLERFMSFAAKWKKPIVLHAVYEDAQIVCDLLEKHHIKKAHFHWFKGDNTVLNRMIESGYFISITPDCLYEDEIQQLIRQYPLEKMMVETDGPWPFEGPFKGQQTEPNMIIESIRKIALLNHLSVEETTKKLYENTKQFYEI